LATKIQEKEDNERQNNIAMINLKEHYTTRIAELQNEIVELRQKLERSQEKAVQHERQYQSEIDFLNNSLKEALEKEQEQQRSLLLLQKELTFFKKENQKHKALLKNPLVKLILMIFSFFQRYLKQTA
jgi:membrane-bound ClpP family serine protease